MKTIGLIGGMSWESSDIYYQEINRKVKNKLGGLNSAKIVLYSVNFEEIEKLQSSGQWDLSGEILAEIAIKLEKAGVDGIALCTNTMHKLATQIQNSVGIPFLHIADSTIKEIKAKKLQKVALLGTAFTMEQTFYKSKFQQASLDILIPDELDRGLVHGVIYNELCQGKIIADSQESFKSIIQKLKNEGAEGIILGCTEIGLLIQQNDVDIPLFDTTHLHIQDIVDFILE